MSSCVSRAREERFSCVLVVFKFEFISVPIKGLVLRYCSLNSIPAGVHGSICSYPGDSGSNSWPGDGQHSFSSMGILPHSVFARRSL